MPDTLPNINLPTNVWVDLYAASGLPVGTAIEADNIGASPVRLTVRATQPPPDYDSFNVLPARAPYRLRNTEGDSGAWALCKSAPGAVNIRALT